MSIRLDTCATAPFGADALAEAPVFRALLFSYARDLDRRGDPTVGWMNGPKAHHHCPAQALAL